MSLIFTKNEHNKAADFKGEKSAAASTAKRYQAGAALPCRADAKILRRIVRRKIKNILPTLPKDVLSTLEAHGYIFRNKGDQDDDSTD